MDYYKKTCIFAGMNEIKQTAVGGSREPDKGLCLGPKSGSTATGHTTPQVHHPVLRMGCGEDGRGVNVKLTTQQYIPI